MHLVHLIVLSICHLSTVLSYHMFVLFDMKPRGGITRKEIWGNRFVRSLIFFWGKFNDFEMLQGTKKVNFTKRICCSYF